VDVRIGVSDTNKELNIDLDDDVDPDDVKADIEAAVVAGSGILWLTDRKGRNVGVPAARIAYVDVGSAASDPQIGFGAT
jgi:hypothetical protein